MSTPLIDFQRTIAAALMRPLTRQDNLRRGADAAFALVKPNARLSGMERLEIYARSYWSRLLDAFGEDFPGLRAVLGAAAFERMRHQCQRAGRIGCHPPLKRHRNEFRQHADRKCANGPAVHNYRAIFHGYFFHQAGVLREVPLELFRVQ